MAGETLLIRADASTEMGTGHVMRCLALAQAWQEAGGTARAVSSAPSEGLVARLESEDIGVAHLAARPGAAVDAAETIRYAGELGATWLVLDGYHFDDDYQQLIKKAGLHLLLVDDNGRAGHCHADLVLNQNIYAASSLYTAREPECHLLLGTRYALLRREFWPWRGWRRQVLPAARRILVTLGGSDPENVTLKAVHALAQMDLEDIEVVLILGSSNRHEGSLQEAIRALPVAIQVKRRVADMSGPMQWADACLAAGGTTCWELALMGLPGILFILADNQRANAEGLHAVGAAHNLGWHRDVSTTMIAHETKRVLVSQNVRATMAYTGQRLVDGHGGERVVAEMLGRSVVRVRPAQDDDMARLFEWANDPLTRAMSFHPEPISWPEHEGWFRRVTSQAGVLLFVVEVEQGEEWVPCGQVRLDEDGTISISVAPRYRGRGLAVPALRAAIGYGRHQGRRELRALIKPENERSQRVFVQAGFEPAGEAVASEQTCLAYIYRYPQPAADREQGG